MGVESSRANQLLMQQTEFESFAAFLKQACGIALAPNKQYLVSTRIRRLLDENNFATFADLIEALKHNRPPRLREQIIDAMTTNETYWFRDGYPFEYLTSHVLRELYRRRDGQDIRIWSAACSSGQEPYSLSMVVDEYNQRNFEGLAHNVRIVATDLSPSMLQVACLGVYERLSMARGLSAERTQRFFDTLPDGRWRIKDSVKNRVEFKYLNLLDNYASLGKFDVIFCRNVLIYFSSDVKQDILTRLHAALKPNGILCLGSSEGINGVPDLYQMIYCNPGILYQARH